MDVITDGFDSSSIIDRRELIRRAQAAGVTIYSVTLPSYMISTTRSGERVITPLDASRVVSATGGNDFSADTSDYTPISGRSLRRSARAISSPITPTGGMASITNSESSQRALVSSFERAALAIMRRYLDANSGNTWQLLEVARLGR